MTKILQCFLLIFFLTGLQAQSCFHTNLSRQFDIQAKLIRHPECKGQEDSIMLYIFRKNSNIFLQRIIFNVDYYDHWDYNCCDLVKSYETGYNDTMLIMDNDFGNIVVADFNFDGKYDIAIKRAEGGNSGPVYNFYLLQNNGKFKLDTFLSEKMGYFPDEFDKKSSTLTTRVHAGACCLGETVFKYNKQSQQWRKVSRRLLR